MTMNLKQGWLLAVLIVFLLHGCSDELITSSKGDPEPDIEEGEETLDSENLIVAQYSTDAGRVPLPNDLILSRINARRASDGEDELNGMSPNMPIRIPFTNSIDVPDFDYSSAAGMMRAATWASNILIVPLGLSDAAKADPETLSGYQASLADPMAVAEESPFLALPTNDVAGNFISVPLQGRTYTGKFKTVYQDANHDLVLVPQSTTSTTGGTFNKGRKYAVIVKKSLKEGLIEDILFAVLKSEDPLHEGTSIKNPLLIAQDTDLQTVIGLESLRQGIASILTASGQDKDDVAVVQTFTTEFSTAAESAAGESLMTAMFSNAVDSNNARNNDIEWETQTSITSIENSAFNFKPFFQGSGVPVNNIDRILSGFYNCQNFLANSGSAENPVWTLDLINRATVPGTDCPHTENAFEGKIEFWLADPVISTTGVVIYQHGITRNRDDFIAVANTFAGAGLATIAIDIWGHGTRTYEDGDRDGSVEPATPSDATSQGDSGLRFIRPDKPLLSAGYIEQTLADMGQLTTLIKENSSLRNALGLTDTSPTHFVGHSLGGVFGSMVAVILDRLNGMEPPPYQRMVLNTPGGDITDFVLESPAFGPDIETAVAESLGLQNPSAELNAVLLGLELGTMHAVAAGNVEPLVFANRDTPASVLLQEIKGDAVIPNSNSELLARSMGLTKKRDGEGQVESSTTRVQWIFNPDNYSTSADGNPAAHAFFIDRKTTATTKAQLQALCYLITGNILDPSDTINPPTCTQ